jgi:hypothetical protein
MNQIVRAACPGCHRPLSIPANWTGHSVRCKHCGTGMHVRRRDAVPMATAADAGPVPTWEPLPEYTPPITGPAPATNGQAKSYVSAYDTRDRYTGQGTYRPRSKGLPTKALAVGLTFLVLVGGGLVVAAIKPDLFKSKPTTTVVSNDDPKGGTPAPGESPAAAAGFPRRLLAISIHSYLYANPIHNGATKGFAEEEINRTGTDAAVRRLAQSWRVPKDQIYHLTDAPLVVDRKAADLRPGKAEPGKKEAVRPEAMPNPADQKAKVLPLKSVIEGTVQKFVETSRTQDRVVLVFCGHLVEKGGAAYLVPLEGDLDELESLIPLKWVYEQVAACPAQEKIVLFDVCRFHPERGVTRPHNGPMSETLEKALHDSPDGVTVLTSCSKGEQALELDYLSAEMNEIAPGKKGTRVDMYGSFFLNMLRVAEAAGMFAPEKKLPEPGDEIPVERLGKWMADKLAEIVFNKYGQDRKQTVKITVKRRGEAVAFNAEEPMPARFAFPTPPPSADPRAVMQIVREIDVPPVKAFREDAPPAAISDILPFKEEVLQPYLAGELAAGAKPNAFQEAVLAAVEGMRAVGVGGGKDLPEEFGGQESDKEKADFKRIQEVPAKVEFLLGDLRDALQEVGAMKDKQPKRWQAHYEYVLAQLKLRMCYANQYNLALANVRGGKFPDLKPGENGYRLTAETALDKLTPSEYKEMFADAKKALNAIIKEHPNTPWALLAKGDRTLSIGLKLTGATRASASR